MIRQCCSHSHAVLCTDWGEKTLKTIHQRNTTEAKLFGIQKRQRKVLSTISSDDAQDLQPKDKNIRLCDPNPVTLLIVVAKKAIHKYKEKKKKSQKISRAVILGNLETEGKPKQTFFLFFFICKPLCTNQVAISNHVRPDSCNM